MLTQNTDELAHKVQILSRLAESTIALNSTLKLKVLLSELMNTAAGIVEAEGASVLLWDARQNELRFAATTTGSATEALIGMPVPLDRSLAGAIWREQRTLVVEDADTDPRHFQHADVMTAFHTRTLIGVPMRSRERAIGVLEAVNKRVPPWTEDDGRYLEILASQAAVAIEGAQMVAALQRANEELAQLDKLKSDFIALASHELRTPLGVILGYATFLQENPEPAVRDFADKVVDSALQLRRITDDLTNLRFLDHQESSLERTRVRLREFIDRTVASARAADLAVPCPVRVGPVPKLTLTVDEVRLGRALENLLLNAMRFTPAGGEVSVEAEVNKNELWIKVRDTGIGIAPENLERIFGRFQQVEDHLTRQYGGMGIGLSIARGLVEAHGGRLWATSPGLNQGATFVIALPLGGE